MISVLLSTFSSSCDCFFFKSLWNFVVLDFYFFNCNNHFQFRILSIQIEYFTAMNLFGNFYELNFVRPQSFGVVLIVYQIKDLNTGMERIDFVKCFVF